MNARTVMSFEEVGISSVRDMHERRISFSFVDSAGRAPAAASAAAGARTPQVIKSGDK
ncbi:hypothetical protein AB0B50_11070 [Streptomyces sp. NPDC041068]|uniref:hypothetical protein n=1 Tax=Streptomyces sp. NPDC041068 TaxID=3155130 RepID=UPI0033E11786